MSSMNITSVHTDVDSDSEVWMVVYRILEKLLIVTTGFGTASNIVNIMVFYRQGVMADSCTMTLTALAVSDLALCFVHFVSGTITLLLVAADGYDPSMAYDEFHGYLMKPGPTSYLKVHSYVATLPVWVLFEVNAWLTAYLAVERMVSVTFPFQVKTLFTTKRSRVIIILFFILPILLHVPTYLSRKVISYDLQIANGTVGYDHVISGIVSGSVVSDMTFLNKTILRVFYIILIVCCNVTIAFKVNLSQKFRTSMKSATKTKERATKLGDSTITSKNENATDSKNISDNPVDSKTRREISLVRTMYVLSLTFLIGRTPYAIFVSLKKLETDTGHQFSSGIYNALDVGGRFLINLSGATNIFVYYILSKKYREVFTSIFSTTRSK